MSISRAKLESLVDELVRSTIEPCRLALNDAGLSTSDVDAILLVGGMTRMPAIQEAVKGFFGKEPTKGVNPDEVVALGAAIQAGVLGGDVKDILLLDVTPLTLSVETLGRVATAMIDRNTTIPSKKSQVYSTAADNQNQVEIHIVQGERPMAGDNKSLGRFILDGIPPAPRGLPQIEVIFDIDANGILNVSAKDKATGREQAITITASSGLSDDEVDKMVEEAEKFASQDAERKEEAEVSNQAEGAIFQAEKLIREHNDKLPEEAVQQTEEKIEAVRQAQASENVSEITAATEALMAQLQTLGAQMYEEDAPPAEDQPETNDEDVIDAEFTET